MQTLATLLAGGYRGAGLTKLKLGERLADGQLPQAILDDLGDTLEHLDLSGTGLASLPADFGARLPRLRIAFFSSCAFESFPAAALAGCGQLEMVAFRSNGMASLPAEAFEEEDGAGGSRPTPLAKRLRWLILTDNRLATLPASISRCGCLEKCMLSGNRLEALPDAMAACQSLTLLRLSANRMDRLPGWLLTAMPRLAFLSFAGNPCSSAAPSATTTRPSTASASALPHIDWKQIEVHHVLGEGASGIISKGVVRSSSGLSGESTPVSGMSTPALQSATTTTVAEDAVAIKIFRGALTSDGTPFDEMAANIAAGHHVNLVRVHGQIRFAEEEEGGEEDEILEEAEKTKEEIQDAFKGGIVMELIPPHYRVLGQPPSFASCTRDRFDDRDDSSPLSVDAALSILAGVASAAEHLHGRGIAHGDLYAHNILVTGHDKSSKDDKMDTHAILSDFGAATLYGTAGLLDPLLEKIEVLAFAHLVADVLGLIGDTATDETTTTVGSRLQDLHRQCEVAEVAARPTFATVVGRLTDIQSEWSSRPRTCA
ncbi:serine/threonine-protein kinase [Grosmannia clavigera kw1407]|uniref:Serine/threonine-protein kinase n=1 Tax=Grosmannia clavigera (strain kw1407 / UAMH 11150) TaxID=655863 RepID=F0XHR2_GROCL|nr:serine/threonine-protein kinase [Grosmannia clavigera kw1407]EFX03015.1 serine/threonine-protein kinase [Grosmannia clavigera kw1407]